MIPISTISRLWKPSPKESSPSPPGPSKIPQRAKRSAQSKEQRVLPDTFPNKNDDPFIDEHSPTLSDSGKIPPNADLEPRTDKGLSKACESPSSDADADTDAGSGTSRDNHHPSFSIPNNPIFLGEDFAGLLKVSNIRNKESIWVDFWIPIRPGDKVTPLDSQYLSSLRSFVGLRYLKISGMLKSYQKEIFRAVWKMDLLEELDLRMAEEPQLSAGVYWRRIEKGWTPRSCEPKYYAGP